jgi:hypothetical protein
MIDKNETEDNKIVLFSAKKPEQVIEKDKKIETTKTEDQVELDKQKDLKETENQKIADKETAKVGEQSDKIDNQEVKKETEEPEPNKFKVNNSGKADEVVKDKVKETEPMSEQAVLSFLKTKGIEVATINDLSKKEVLSEPVLEFKKFNDKTGRGVEAYFNSKKDWGKSDEDDTIKEYYRYNEPNLSEEDIENELVLIKLTEDERDDLSEREVREVDQRYRKTYAKALSYMENVSKEYSIPREEKKIEQKQISEEDKAKAYQPYWDKRDASLEKLKEISIKVDNLGEIKLPITQSQKDLIAKVTQTQEDHFGRWMGKDGTIDTDKSSLDVAYSIPEIRDELHSEMINQVYNLLKENESKTRRNVTLDGSRANESKTGKKGVITFNSKGEESENRMGQPLIPTRN